MSSFAFVTVVAVSAIPCEYHLDFASCPMGTEHKFDYRFTAWDGTVYNSGVGLGPASNPNGIRHLTWFGPKREGWRGEVSGEFALVIRGSKKGAIRSVEVTGDGWKPTVRWVPLLPAKK